ncbi:alpha/beta fold hydrolase [Fredinandcohnia humi]
MNQTKGCFAKINGTSIYYEVKGEGNPLLLIHGLPVDSRMWDGQFEVLSQQYKVIRFDLAGFGLSGVHDEDYSLLNDVKSLLDYLQISRTSLLGFSVGGKLSIEFALTYPEMVDRLILASSGLTGWTEESIDKQRYNEEVNKCFQSGDQECAIELMTNAWVIGPYRNNEEVRQDVQERFSVMVKNTFAKPRGQGKLLFPDINSFELIEQIKVHTLIILPEFDFPDFNQIGDYLHKKIKNSKKITIKNTAHMLNMEEPSVFNKLVLQFLQQNR